MREKQIDLSADKNVGWHMTQRKEDKDKKKPAMTSTYACSFKNAIDARKIDDDTYLIIDDENNIQIRNIQDQLIGHKVELGKVYLDMICMRDLAIVAVAEKAIILKIPSLEKQCELDGVFVFEGASIISPTQFSCIKMGLESEGVIIDLSNPNNATIVSVLIPTDITHHDLDYFTITSHENKQFAVMGLSDGSIEFFPLTELEEKRQHIQEEGQQKTLLSMTAMHDGKLVITHKNHWSLLKKKDPRLTVFDLVSKTELPIPPNPLGNIECKAIPAFDGDGFVLISANKPNSVHFWHVDLPEFVSIVFKRPFDKCFYQGNQFITVSRTQVDVYHLNLSPELLEQLHETLAEHLTKDTSGMVISYLFSTPSRRPTTPTEPSPTIEHKGKPSS